MYMTIVKITYVCRIVIDFSSNQFSYFHFLFELLALKVYFLIFDGFFIIPLKKTYDNVVVSVGIGIAGIVRDRGNFSYRISTTFKAIRTISYAY